MGKGKGEALSSWLGSSPPQKAKRDKSEAGFVEIIRSHGINVCLTDKPLDAIAGFGGATYLLEFKSGPKAPLTQAQKDFFALWPGHAEVISTDEEAIQFAQKVRRA